MYRLILLLVVVDLVGCAHQDEWSSRDTTLQIALTVVVAADAYTTSKIQYREDLMESNPIAVALIGRQPTTRDSWLLMGSFAVSYYIIARALPAKWRPYYQGFNLLSHSYYVYKNCENDLC